MAEVYPNSVFNVLLLSKDKLIDGKWWNIEQTTSIYSTYCISGSTTSDKNF
jgi:hypothetical protein